MIHSLQETFVPQLPDHVQSRLQGPPPNPKVESSPYGPSPASAYPRPRLQWVLLYGPLVAWVSLMVMQNKGRDDADAWVLAAVVPALVLIPALVRVPQELTRRRNRAWVEADDGKAWTWSDPSGEWAYASWQSEHVVPVLRFGVAAGMVGAWVWAVRHETFGLLVFLPFAVAALVYVHRHLPTPLRPLTRNRVCHTCGKVRGEHSVPMCKCGRIAHVETTPGLPGLQPRFRDL